MCVYLPGLQAPSLPANMRVNFCMYETGHVPHMAHTWFRLHIIRSNMLPPHHANSMLRGSHNIDTGQL